MNNSDHSISQPYYLVMDPYFYPNFHFQYENSFRFTDCNEIDAKIFELLAYHEPNNIDNSNVEINEPVKKKRRTNYKKPENAIKLQEALDKLISLKLNTHGTQDIQSIARMYNIPYNTLRDNYLRAIGCDPKISNRQKRNAAKEISTTSTSSSSAESTDIDLSSSDNTTDIDLSSSDNTLVSLL